ncbi:MAG TPA: Cj0069 family protein [Chloroflexota bacterium]|nr:Cj0069 family protein [Chloroflexota bacterium]
MSGPPRVGVLWRGDPATHVGAAAEGRLGATLAALRARGLHAEPVVFADHVADQIRAHLRQLDAVLVWVDPFMNGVDRTVLDAVLRDAASAGVWVSAHPDVILAMGAKDVLVRTQHMGWGTPCVLYSSLTHLRDALPARLALGPRVLKQHRGNGGNGVWKVEALGPETPDLATPVRVLHAARGSALEELPLGVFVDRCAPHFAGAGCMIEQPYQQRLADGMIRCYLVGDRVAGFGHQYVTALLPPPDGTRETPPAPPRLYYGPTKPEFQNLKLRLESAWVDEMISTLGLTRDQLPALWDADFLHGPSNDRGEDTYVLCEINVSSVYPFPDEALAPLADHVARRLTSPAGR